VILSAPALASLHVPVASLAPALDSKDTDASQATPFKNVFDSLTLFEDSPQQGDAGQEHGGLPHSSKKTQPESSGAGTEDAIVPQAPARSGAKTSLVLSLPAMGVASESAEAPDDKAPEQAPLLELGNSPEPSDAPSSLTTKSQPASNVQQAQVPSSVSASPTLAAALSSGTAQVAAPATKAIPAQVVETATTSAMSTTVKTVSTAPPAPESVQAQSVQAQPVQTKPVQETAVPVQTAQANPTLPARTLPVYQLHQPAATVRPFTSLPTPQTTSASAPKSSPIASSLPTRTPGTAAPAPQRVAAPQYRAPQASAPAASAPASVETSQSYPVTSNPPVSNAPQAVAPTPVLAAPADDQASTPGPLPSVAISAPDSATKSKLAQKPSAVDAKAQQPSTSASESNAPVSIVPVSIVPPAESAPEPTLAAAATAMASLAPLPTGHEATDRAPETAGTPAPQHEALAATSAPKAPLVPEAENFAFAVRMAAPENSSGNSSLTQQIQTPASANGTPVTQTKSSVAPPTASAPQPAPSPESQTPESQTSDASQRAVQSSAPEMQQSNTGARNPSELQGAQPTQAITPHWNDSAVSQSPEIGFQMVTQEPAEAAQPSLPLAAQEAHLLSPELPRTSAGSEILLHLTGNDQTSAAIRVADRAGTVNVSVHTSDPVLRESLRSNLGELSTQLNDQGWKADVMKSASVAAHSEGQQDSHAGGQRGSQQQSSGGERQPQRDRRASGGQWQQELDQHITGGDAHPGGNG
jgi:hypothetical protein